MMMTVIMLLVAIKLVLGICSRMLLAGRKCLMGTNKECWCFIENLGELWFF